MSQYGEDCFPLPGPWINFLSGQQRTIQGVHGLVLSSPGIWFSLSFHSGKPVSNSLTVVQEDECASVNTGGSGMGKGGCCSQMVGYMCMHGRFQIDLMTGRAGLLSPTERARSLYVRRCPSDLRARGWRCLGVPSVALQWREHLWGTGTQWWVPRGRGYSIKRSDLRGQ